MSSNQLEEIIRGGFFSVAGISAQLDTKISDVAIRKKIYRLRKTGFLEEKKSRDEGGRLRTFYHLNVPTGHEGTCS